MITLIVVGMLLLLFGAYFFVGFGRSQAERSTFIYLLVALIIGALLSGFVWFANRKDENWGSTYLMLQLSMLAIGVFHTLVMYRSLFWVRRNVNYAEKDSFWAELVFSAFIMLILTVVIVFPIAYVFNISVASKFKDVCILFLLPFLSLKCFDALNQIPYIDHAWKWTFNKDRINEDNWTWQNETWVQFEVNSKLNSQVEGRGETAKFKAFVPKNTPLREVFRLGVREYNEKSPKVRLYDLGYESGNLDHFYWLFTIDQFDWRRMNTWFTPEVILNPYDSIQKNALDSTKIVKAKRVLFAEPVHTLANQVVAMGEL
jgi:hypothetical protein